MKASMGALDIRASVAEMQGLVRGRVQKVLAGKSTVAISVHAAATGKKWMIARLPGFFYMCDDKPELGSPAPFQSALKKFIEGAKLEAVEQLGFERAVKLTFDSKEGSIDLVLELFTNGNAVLLSDAKILTLLKKEEGKHAKHAPGSAYALPSGKPSTWDLSPSAIVELLEASPDPSSAVLGGNGMGKLWAREACLQAGVDPVQQVKGALAKKLAKAVVELRTAIPDPHYVFHEEVLVDVVPFPMKAYESDRQEKGLFGEGIALLQKQLQKRSSSVSGKISKIEDIIAKQTSYLSELESEHADQTRKGEIIFEKYQLVSEILAEIKKARERLSWKEIKARLKNHPVIKDIDESKGDIVVEV